MEWSHQPARCVALLAVFTGLMSWTVWHHLQKKPAAPGSAIAQELAVNIMPARHAIFWLVTGLGLLIASSRLLVWGAIEIALGLGVSDLIIGLTIVAVGTSLPELASSIAAARKKEHDIVLGNIIGSNLFNTLVVVGVAGLIRPLEARPEIFSRDMMVMSALTISLFIIGYSFGKPGCISRLKGAALLLCFISYTAYLVNIAGSSPSMPSG